MIVKIINGLALSVDNPIKEDLIYDKLVCLQKRDIPFSVYSLEIYHTKLVQHLYQKITGKKIENPKRIKWNLPEQQYSIHIKKSILSHCIEHFFPNLYYSHIISKFNDYNKFNNSEYLIHAHVAYPHGYIAYLLSKKYQVPFVVTAHGSDIHTNPLKSNKVMKYTLETLNAADKVMFVSHALLASAIDLGYSGKNAVVIPNGIDPEYLYPMEKEEAIIRTGWKQTHKYVVGFVGNLIPVKRADKFVEIFSQIQQRVNDVEFIVIGEGYLKESIRAECQKHGLQVTFTGKIPHEDIVNWMNLFDVMILPSRNEGWPCVVLEAYACGTPVIGSANGGIPEALHGLCPSVMDGDSFEERFSEVVCDVLTRKITVDREKLVSKALEYTWKKCVDKEISIYMDTYKNIGGRL